MFNVRKLIIPPKPVDQGGPEQPAKLTPLYEYVDIIINMYTYTRNDNNIILYSAYRKIWTGSIEFNALLVLIYYSLRLY